MDMTGDITNLLGGGKKLFFLTCYFANLGVMCDYCFANCDMPSVAHSSSSIQIVPIYQIYQSSKYQNTIPEY